MTPQAVLNHLKSIRAKTSQYLAAPELVALDWLINQLEIVQLNGLGEQE